jgi:hypothetical protein
MTTEEKENHAKSMEDFRALPLEFQALAAILIVSDAGFEDVCERPEFFVELLEAAVAKIKTEPYKPEEEADYKRVLAKMESRLAIAKFATQFANLYA